MAKNRISIPRRIFSREWHIRWASLALTTLAMLFLLVAEPAQGSCIASFTDDFSDGTIDPRYTVSSSCGTPTEAGGVLNLDKPVCFGDSSVGLSAPSALCGDFDVSVDFDVPDFAVPSSGSRYAGIQIRRRSDDAFVATIERYSRQLGDCNPSTQNYKAYTTSPLNCSSTLVATTDASGRFRIARTGSQLDMYYWGGSGWVLLRTEAGTTDDVYLLLFSGTDLDTSSHDARFDNLSVSTSTAVPALSPVGVVAVLLVLLAVCGVHRTRSRKEGFPPRSRSRSSGKSR